MRSVACQTTNAAHSSPTSRGRFLSVLDALAEWQMRQQMRVISRNHRLRAASTKLTQPSSVIERSSTSPCDR
jgi:hypothetical protein